MVFISKTTITHSSSSTHFELCLLLSISQFINLSFLYNFKLIILNVSIIIRCNVVGAAITSFVLSIVAQYLVSTGNPIFRSDNIHQELFQLNSFIIASSISFMMIGVFIKQLKVLNLKLEPRISAARLV